MRTDNYPLSVARIAVGRPRTVGPRRPKVFAGRTDFDLSTPARRDPTSSDQFRVMILGSKRTECSLPARLADTEAVGSALPNRVSHHQSHRRLQRRSHRSHPIPVMKLRSARSWEPSVHGPIRMGTPLVPRLRDYLTLGTLLQRPSGEFRLVPTLAQAGWRQGNQGGTRPDKPNQGGEFSPEVVKEPCDERI